MQLDWSTFILEIINLLVLVWLLKHFLYQPLLNMIERRRREINATLSEAQQRQNDAETLKNSYEERLAQWEEEKRQARQTLDANLEQERARRMQLLEEELAGVRQAREKQDQQQQSQWRAEAENEAMHQAAEFTRRLLTSLSGPELDQRLRALFFDQLHELPEAMAMKLREGWGDSETHIEVTSATPLDDETKQGIRTALERRMGQPSAGSWHFQQDEGLIAGLRVSIGGWLLRANLSDELYFFVEAFHEQG